MRRDMDRVIITRGRGGAMRRKPGRRLPLEMLPAFESTSRHRGGTKYFGDHLGPLRRFLRQRVGRPWDEVYSEIRAQLDGVSTLKRHVMEHLDRMVERRPLMVAALAQEEGARCTDGARHRFYVCPTSGRLKALC